MEILHNVEVLRTNTPTGTVAMDPDFQISASLEKPEKRASDQNLIGLYTSQKYLISYTDDLFMEPRAAATCSCPGSQPMATCPECHTSHICRLTIWVILRCYLGLCTDVVGFTLQLRKSPENLSQDIVDKGCATSHHLKWDPLPPNDVIRIPQHIREGKGS